MEVFFKYLLGKLKLGNKYCLNEYLKIEYKKYSNIPAEFINEYYR
ncbi:MULTISPECIES: hypothetical protein [Tissierellales]|jgi:hypothetical protein|nr:MULTISPECIES: hypothetical protein [Tissierellales]SCL85676.1 hypothetical protein PP176A_0919 [Sporanaerobacter sp. PP17-6a]